jgi:hypothetical protein
VGLSSRIDSQKRSASCSTADAVESDCVTVGFSVAG